MIGSDSIDLSLKNIWRSWFEFRKGKRVSIEMHTFQYSLEKNLYELWEDLQNGSYRHGEYRKFVINENKRREISVASIRDRIVHRLIYEYLEKIYDKTFIYDAWSCRKGKGLIAAIERAQGFLKPFLAVPHYSLKNGYGKPFKWVWKSDVKKFFDSVDHETLLKILAFRIKDTTTFNLLSEVINNYTAVPETKVGMPIGNLTSQIFANVYLNELDRFVKYNLGVRSYLRYGDDFIILENDREKLELIKGEVVSFLNNELKLRVNLKSDKIIKPMQGLKFLGMKIWPFGKTLTRRNLARIRDRMGPDNISSYSGIVKRHGNRKYIRRFNWLVYEKVLVEFL